MPSAVASWVGRVRDAVRDWFAVDDDWVRPPPPVGRADLVVAACFEAGAVVTLELSRSAAVLSATHAPVPLQYLAVSTAAFPLLFRRRYPLTLALYAALHMFVLGLTMPQVMGGIAVQACYFMAFFSAMAWAASRRQALAVVGAIIAGMFLWLAWQYALGTGVQEYLDSVKPTEQTGFFPPIVAAVLITFVINLVYFFGALIGGQAAWRAARAKARLAEQAATIAEQADHLRRRAVLDERLRIARELHDVVGHHVSVIGVQAAAARRVMGRDDEAAARALAGIETSSRDAVTQMRGLLGTLRALEEPAAGGSDRGGERVVHRAPEPGLADLPTLAAERTATGLLVAYDLVDPHELAPAVDPTVGLSLYRTAQEALANVGRHSSASRATLIARLDREYAEVEVLDEGRPLPATSGSGLGQLGIRERAASHGGLVEIGPRVTGGYRVRLRIPLNGSGGSHA